MNTMATIENPQAKQTTEATSPADAQRKGLRPKFTHCDICGKELPDEELRMQAVNHRECWKVWVEEKRNRDPEAVVEKEA